MEKAHKQQQQHVSYKISLFTCFTSLYIVIFIVHVIRRKIYRQVIIGITFTVLENVGTGILHCNWWRLVINTLPDLEAARHDTHSQRQ